jgi:hypothetical protein
MSLEQLISKYLDGELTSTEDERLRSMLSEDAAARDEFDTSVYVHMALREDAESIEPDKELLKETEDEVLMRIMNQKPEGDMPVIIPAEKKRRPKIMGIISVAAAFLVAGLFTITDMDEFRFNPANNAISANSEAEENPPAQTTPENLAQSIPAEDQAKAVVKSASGASGGGSAPTGKMKIPAAADDFSGAMAFFDPDFEQQVGAGLMPDSAPESDGKVITLASDMPSGVFASQSGAVGEIGLSGMAMRMPRANANTYVSRGNILAVNNFENALEFEEIQLTTFFGTDVFMDDLGNSKKTLVTNISQSIAYSYNENIRFGMEAGVTSFEYDEVMIVRIPADKYEGMTEELTDDYIGVPMEVHRNNNLIWAAAFYEHTLFSNDDMALMTRLGVGGSGDGPLGYGRIFGKYRIIGDLYITAGAESRVFMLGLPASLGGKEFRNSLSLIYGLQFRL